MFRTTLVGPFGPAVRSSVPVPTDVTCLDYIATVVGPVGLAV